jgi:hypothetical protein
MHNNFFILLFLNVRITPVNFFRFYIIYFTSGVLMVFSDVNSEVFLYICTLLSFKGRIRGGKCSLVACGFPPPFSSFDSYFAI